MKISLIIVLFMQMIYSEVIDEKLLASCNKKDAISCYEIGKKYLKKELNDENIKSILKYYERACILGEMKVCYRLARLYHLQKEIPVDFNKSMKYYRKACEGNHAQACNNTGSHYRLGNSVTINYKKALEYYEKSYILGGTDASSRNIEFVKGLIRDRKECLKQGNIWNYRRRECEI